MSFYISAYICILFLTYREHFTSPIIGEQSKKKKPTLLTVKTHEETETA